MLLSRKWYNPNLLNSRFPERVLQIGEGRFLRGFVDWMIDELNNQGVFKGSVVVVAPRPNGAANLAKLRAQDNLYTVWLRGIKNNEEINSKALVSSISRCIDPYTQWQAILRCAENPDIDICVSNTTEAGLIHADEPYEPHTPPQTYPAKLTAYLYHRFLHFNGSRAHGMVVVPCELVEDNGYKLKEIILQYARNWNLPEAFIHWVTHANHFCNTLVDRIVSGLPPQEELGAYFDELGYEDQCLTVGEPFHLWAIQDEGKLRFRWPLKEIGFNVLYVDDVSRYRTQKVRVLNGTHTAIAPLALLCGCRTVYQAVNNELVSSAIKRIVYDEIVPTLDLPGTEVKTYADSVLERFRNPYIRHELKDIMLNALSKFRVRLLPTFNGYVGKFGRIPPVLSLTFATFLLFYRSERDSCGQMHDSHPDLGKFVAIWSIESQNGLFQTVCSLLACEGVWGQDLNRLPNLCENITHHIQEIRNSSLERYAKGIVTAN